MTLLSTCLKLKFHLNSIFTHQNSSCLTQNEYFTLILKHVQFELSKIDEIAIKWRFEAV
jgi:hypothetical protein